MRLIVAALAVLAVTAPLSAAEPTVAPPETATSAAESAVMSPLFGNTLVYESDMDADDLHKAYAADHTWVSWYPLSRASRGNSYNNPHHRGTWEFRGDGVLCDTYRRSSVHPHVVACQKMSAHHVGDKWKDAAGDVTLVSGVQ